jgi:hypothetical protein
MSKCTNCITIEDGHCNIIARGNMCVHYTYGNLEEELTRIALEDSEKAEEEVRELNRIIYALRAEVGSLKMQINLFRVAAGTSDSAQAIIAAEKKDNKTYT